MVTEYKPEFRRYAQKNISTQKLDELMTFVMRDNGTGYLAAIIAALKLLVCAAYLIARNSLVDKELMLEKQLFEQELALHLQDQNEVI